MSARTRWGFDRASGAKARPRPLVRPTAYRGPWPILAGRTMAEVMRDEEELRLGVSTSLDPNGNKSGKKEALPRIESGVTKQDPVRVARPEQVSAPVAVVSVNPLPSQPLPARVPQEKIILTSMPSGMESAAREWIKPASLAVTQPLPAVPDDSEKVWCGGCDARVPMWFGRDCISVACELRGPK